MAAGVTLLLVAGGLIFFFSHLFRPADPDTGGKQPEGPTVAQLVERSRQLLSDGDFAKALDVLQEGMDRGERNRELLQLHRQAQLLAKLLDLPLQDIIQKGQNVRNADAWQKEFNDRYRGWSILFDDWVRRNPDGKHELVNYQIIVGEEKAVVKLDLDLLTTLPLGQPRRLLFGAKLASVARRGAGGQWVIEFEKDSGVLITEEGAAIALGLAPLDAEIKDVLSEQKRWVLKPR
jgi:hypothetical protein